MSIDYSQERNPSYSEKSKLKAGVLLAALGLAVCLTVGEATDRMNHPVPQKERIVVARAGDTEDTLIARYIKNSSDFNYTSVKKLIESDSYNTDLINGVEKGEKFLIPEQLAYGGLLSRIRSIF